jgi:hypothetical protein
MADSILRQQPMNTRSEPTTSGQRTNEPVRKDWIAMTTNPMKMANEPLRCVLIVVEEAKCGSLSKCSTMEAVRPPLPSLIELKV